jgi:hypothetical protein
MALVLNSNGAEEARLRMAHDENVNVQRFLGR